MMFMVALFAVMVAGVFGLMSDDSFADSSGDVMSGSTDIGDYTFVSKTGELTLTAASGEHYGTVPTGLVDPNTGVAFDELSDVRVIISEGFKSDLSSFFSDYGIVDGVKNLNIIYSGPVTISTVESKYSYDSNTGVFTLMPANDSIKDLTKYGSATSSVLNPTNYFFVGVATEVHLKGFERGGEYVFTYFDNATTFVAENWNPGKGLVKNYGLLNGMAKLKAVHFNAVDYLYNCLFSSESIGRIKELYLPNVTEFSSGFCTTYATEVTKLYIPKITSVAEGCFKKTKLVDVSAESLLNIGKSAFEGCSSLKSIVFANNAIIAQSAFKGCTNLSSISDERIGSIGSYAFEGCTSLKALYIKNATVLNTGAFQGCSKLEFVSLSGTFNAIPNNTFYGCSSLATVCFGISSTDQIPSKSIFSDNLTNIGEFAFYGCGLTGVDFNNVSDIGKESFKNCDYLKSVNLGNSVKKIGEGAFGSCANLTSLVIGGDILESIGSSAFSDSPLSETRVFKIPASLKDLGQSAFEGTDLIEIDFSFNTKITSVPAYAFKGCDNLKILTLTDCITSIGNEAFYGCIQLQFSRDNGEQVSFITPTAIESFGEGAFRDCHLLPSITLSESLTEIGAYSFAGCNQLRSVKLPSSIETLEEGAFMDCGTLSQVDLSSANNIKNIPNHCFDSCDELLSITIPSFITVIGNYAFYGSDRMASITWHDGVTSIGNYAFMGTGISGKLDLPSGIKTIGNSAFESSASISGSIDFPASLLTIGSRAFYKCTGITGITFADGSLLEEISSMCFESCTELSGVISFPDSLQYIKYDAFQSCGKITGIEFDVEKSKLIGIEEGVFKHCYNLTGNVSFPKDMKYLGYDPTYLPGTDPVKDVNGVFTECKLITSIEFGDSLKTIGNAAFYKCTSLMVKGTLNIPSSVELIYSEAFYGVPVKKVVIPSDSNLTSIGALAFQKCTTLEEFECNAIKNVVTLGENTVFQDCNKLKSVTLASVIKIPSEAFKWSISLKILNAPNATDVPKSVISKCTSLEEITLGLTSIADNYLSGYTKLKSVSIDSVESIGDEAFKGCVLLSKVNANNLINIGSNAFFNCSNLTSLSSPSIQVIGDSCFEGCGLLENISKVDDVEVNLSYVTTIGSNAFKGCESLLTVSMPQLTSLGNGAFSGCVNIDSVNIEELSSLGDGIFDGCIGLVSIDAECVTSVGNNVFKGCKYLRDATLGKLTYVGEYAFYLCESLDDSYDLSDVTSVGNYAFYGCDELTGTGVDSTVDITSATTIGTSAFAGCSSIKHFVLGSGINTIGPQALNNPNLISITIDENNQNYSVGDSDGFLYDSIGDIVLCPAKNPKLPVDKKLTLSSGVEKIHDYAFQWVGIEEIVFNNDVANLSIGVHAFSNSALKSVSLSSNLIKSIGSYAFSDCSDLESIVIDCPDTEMGSHIFSGCSSLESASISMDAILLGSDGESALGSSLPIVSYTFTGEKSGNNDADLFYMVNASKMPWYHENDSIAIAINFDGVKSIDPYMFAVLGNGKSVVVSLTMTDTVTVIGASAFSGCSSISTITLSKALTDGSLQNMVGGKDHGYPFTGCDGISELSAPITIDFTEFGAKPQRITSIDFYKGKDGRGVDYDSNASKNILWANSSASSITFHDGVAYIGTHTYLNPSGTLSIPSHVLEIAEYAFHGSTMTGLSIAEGLETLGHKAFGNCGRLETLELPNSLTNFTPPGGSSNVGCSPFYGCKSLSTVTLPITVDYTQPLFMECSITTFNFIEGTNGVGVSYDDGRSMSTPWYQVCSVGDISVTFAEGIVSIGSSMFEGCYDTGDSFIPYGITGTITFPFTLVDIGSNAFKGCESISGFVFRSGLKTIGDFAFYDCKGLTELTIKPGLTVGAGAFQMCSNLTTLTIPISVNAVGTDASNPTFWGCTGLESIHLTGSAQDDSVDYSESDSKMTPWYYTTELCSITLDEKVDRIGTNMFRGSKSILSITVTPNLKSIGENAFMGCISLSVLNTSNDGQNVSGFNSVTTLGNGVFEGCTGLDGSISLSGMTYVPNNTFKGCTNLDTVVLGTVTVVGEYAFYGSAVSKIGDSNSTIKMPALVEVGQYAFAKSGIINGIFGTSQKKLVMEDNVFFECADLLTLTIYGDLDILPENTFKSRDSVSFESDLRELTLSNAINFSAYMGDSFKLLTKVDAPNSKLSSEVDGIFRNCVKLSDVDLASEMTLPAYAFQGCVALAQLDMSSFSLVNGHEFEGCKGLTSITISVKSVPAFAFNGCSKLATVTATNVEELGESSFSGTALTTIGDNFPGLKIIGNNAFSDCKSMVDIVIPGSISEFGSSVFMGCSNLSKVTMPITFDYSQNVFSGCTNLVNFVFTPGIGEYAGIGHEYDVGEAANTPWAVNSKGVLPISVAFSDGVKSIGKNMFRDCTKLSERLTLPSSITEVGEFAFAGANNIRELVVDSTTFFMGKGAFSGCERLETITLPITTNSVVDSVDPAFKGCTSVNRINLIGSGDGFTYSLTGDDASSNAPWNITTKDLTITIGANVTGIGDYTFYGCTKLIGSLISNNLNSIGKSAFHGCNRLAGVTATSLDNLGVSAFEGCSNLSTVNIGDVESVSDRAFYGCSKLVSVIMDDCTTIGDYAFARSGIKNTVNDGGVSLPHVTDIGDYAFAGSKAINVTIGTEGSSLSLGKGVFLGCSELQNFTVNGSIQTLARGTFVPVAGDEWSASSNLKNLIVPKASAVSEMFTGFTKLSEVDIRGAFSLDEDNTAGMFKGCTQLKTVTLYEQEDNTVELPASAFEGCKALSTINLDRVQFGMVGSEFKGCIALTAVNLDAATSIPKHTFDGCSNLGTVNAPNLDTIGENAFANSGLTSIGKCNLENGIKDSFVNVTTIGDNAFENCTKLTYVSIPNVTTIGTYAFKGCTNLADVVLPELNEVSIGMFYGCTKLVNVSSGASSVRKHAFYRCTSLPSITLPNVTSVGESSVPSNATLKDSADYVVFFECNNLRSVVMGVDGNSRTNVNVGAFAFYACSNLESFNAVGSYDLTNVTSIGFAAFSQSGAKDVVVGMDGGISTIGDYAFYACTGLKTFTSFSLTEIPAHLFNNTDVDEPCVVPNLKSIETPNVTSFMANLHDCTYLEYADIGSAITFEPDTFHGCSLLKEVRLAGEGSDRVMLSTGMFYGCEKLSSIDLTNVDFAGSVMNNTFTNTFYGCESLGEVTLSNATKIPSGAFHGCVGITNVVAPIVTDVGVDAFNGCIGLESVDIPAVTKVYDRAFRDCSKLSELNPSSEYSPFLRVAIIGQEAFFGCGFTDLVLGPNLESIGVKAFANNRISELVLPNAPQSRTYVVNEGVFKGCPLTDIHISSSVREIAENAFDISAKKDIRAVNVWFNGSIANMNVHKGAFVGNDNVIFNVYSDSLGTPTARNMLLTGQLQRADLLVVESYSASIHLQAEPTGNVKVSNMTAVHGGKVVLPLVDDYGEKVFLFAVVDNDSNRLAIFESDSMYYLEKKQIARSGDAVPIYPLAYDDTMEFVATVDGSGFRTEMTIETDGSGAEVTPSVQTVHYGSTVVVPTFFDSLLTVNGVFVYKADGSEPYQLETGITQFYAGHYITGIAIVSENMTINVTFVRDNDAHVAEVNLQGKFEVPEDLKYLETPLPGYAFGGWWSGSGGKGIKAGENTKFSVGQTWHAYFVPMEFKLSIVSTKPVFSDELDVVGPYTLHVVNGSLYYTDLNNTGNVLVFDAKGIPGYSVSSYMDDGSMKPITGDYGALTTDIVVELYMTENKYDLELKFMYDGSYVSAEESFSIIGWEVGAGTSFHTGSMVEDIPYRMIENGLIMPVPVHDSYAFTSMTCAAGSVPYRNGNYVLTLDSFNGALSMEIVYVMQKDMYTIQFQLMDDLDSSYNNYESIAVGQTFMMPSVDMKYFKTGYLFSHFEVAGSDVRYQERQSVTLTQEMADMAKYCVVVVRAIWESESYTIGFDLDPYKGTLDAIEGVTVGKEIVLPAVTGYSGYRVSGWHWYSAAGVSDSFEGKVVLTQDIVRDYADGTNITLQVEWIAKTYSLDVDSSTGYKFETKTATFGEDFTLWTNTYNRSFMKFAGWSIGTTLYKDSSTVRLDSVMAAAGDANNDRIVFSMSWIDNEYQVQYNLDGGEGQIPVDDNAYVVNRSEFKLAGNDGEFYQDGYTFVGWKYSKSSYIVYTNTTGLFETVLAQYADENNIVTFYAVWSQKSYKISYDLAGGRAGLNSPTNVFYGDVVDVSKPTRAGYDFAGWTATGLTGGALYSSSAGYRGWDGNTRVTSTMFMDLCNQDGGVVTFTAHWEQATYLVSYNLNGGTGVIIGGQIQIRVGDVIQQPDLRDAFKTGYRYVGWGVDKVNALSVGSTFSADMISDVGNTLVLYAIWSPIEYTVQHRYIDSYAFTTVTVEFEEILPLPALDRPGYTFKGWKITGADSNAYYSRDGSTWYKIGTTDVEGMYFRNLTSVDGGIVTMEASWSTNEYRISYNSNGGTGKAPVDTNLYKVGDTVQLHDYTVLSGTNGSKSIVGWSLEPNGSSVIISEFTEGLAMQADATGAVNLYAVWVDGMCTVIVDLGDATVNEAPSGWTLNANGTYEKIVDYGSDTRNVMKDWEDVTVEKDGYNFTGWDYGSATITSTVTVEPKFEEVNMTILYAFGGVVAAFAIGAIFFTRL